MARRRLAMRHLPSCAGQGIGAHTGGMHPIADFFGLPGYYLTVESSKMRSLLRFLALAICFLGVFSSVAHADEAAIRKALQGLKEFPSPDEVRKLPGGGLYEVRVGNEIYYSDEQGAYIVAGTVLETRTKVNVTEARTRSLVSEQVKTLPLADAITTVRGKGERHLIVFADPNCGYCKKLEPELTKIDNVTIHTFLYPILGPDSVAKSRNIWCAPDAGKAWSEWMIRGKAVAERSPACTAIAVDRNVALGRKMRVTGTPAMFFADGHLVPGAADAGTIEAQLQASAKKKG